MQCIPKFELEKKTKKSETSDDALDDDDDGDIELSALPSGLLEEHQEEEKAEASGLLTKLQTLYALGGALMIVTGVAAFAARQQICHGQATHQTLCTEEGFQEEAM